MGGRVGEREGGFLSMREPVCVSLCICASDSISECVCVQERGGERERGVQERGKEREREYLCDRVCVCVCVGEVDITFNFIDNTRLHACTRAHAHAHPHTPTPTHPHTHTPTHPHIHPPTHPHTHTPTHRVRPLQSSSQFSKVSNTYAHMIFKQY